jgi:hypothetical protein
MHYQPANPRQDNMTAGLEQEVNNRSQCVLVQILTAPATDHVATDSHHHVCQTLRNGHLFLQTEFALSVGAGSTEGGM